MKKPLLLFNLVLPLLFNCTKLFAQKLPNIQQLSVRAPINVKIDGNLTEWNNQFQAYNHAVDIFYTIANDDENLYLVIRATKPRVIDKIIDVGVIFFINNESKRNDHDKSTMSVVYPLIDVANGQRIIINAGKKVKSDVVIPKINGKPVFNDTTDRLPARNDSSIRVANDLISKSAKNIKVHGLKNIADDLLSVYNEEKIKVAAKFDNDGSYNYELAIPLKYLQISSENKKITYGVRLNSRLIEPKRGVFTRYIYPNGVMTDVDQDLDSTTDFWGDYVLIAGK